MGASQIIVKSYFTAKNVSSDPYREYLIDPWEEIKILRFIEKIGQNFIGIYHSHPEGEEHLSEKDKDSMIPEICYLVFSLRINNPIIKLNAYFKKDEEILNLPIRIF